MDNTQTPPQRRMSPIVLISTVFLMYSTFRSGLYTVSRWRIYQTFLSAKEFKSISDLKMHLNSRLGNSSLEGNYVSIRGKVVSKDYIKTKFAEENGKPLDSILYLYTKQKISEILNPANRTFTKKIEQIEKDFRTVPFSLQDETGSVNVNIEKAQEVEIPLKKVYSNLIEESSPSSLEEPFFKALGFSQKNGVEEEEHILEPNTEFIVFGRAIFNEETKKLVIDRFEGKPFAFVQDLSRDQILILSKKALLIWLSITMGSFSIANFIFIYDYLTKVELSQEEKKRRDEQSKRVEPTKVATPVRQTIQTKQPKQTKQTLQTSKQCSLCLSQSDKVVCVCPHICKCENCIDETIMCSECR